MHSRPRGRSLEEQIELAESSATRLACLILLAYFFFMVVTWSIAASAAVPGTGK